MSNSSHRLFQPINEAPRLISGAVIGAKNALMIILQFNAWLF